MEFGSGVAILEKDKTKLIIAGKAETGRQPIPHSLGEQGNLVGEPLLYHMVGDIKEKK